MSWAALAEGLLSTVRPRASAAEAAASVDGCGSPRPGARPAANPPLPASESSRPNPCALLVGNADYALNRVGAFSAALPPVQLRARLRPQQRAQLVEEELDLAVA